MKKKSGFSVVEMLVILALLSIIVVLTLRVGESVTSNSRITGLINNFLADFSQAKLLASAENRYVAITFSADGRSYYPAEADRRQRLRRPGPWSRP